MARGLVIFLSAAVVFSASIYQLLLKDFLHTTIGIGRVIQPIEDFPYSCRRLKHDQLQGCEDLWLDDEGRVLYAACTGTQHRLEWNQAMGKYNVSGRRPGGSELIALNVDEPGHDGLFGMRAIKTVGFTNAAGENSLAFVGFDAEKLASGAIHFYMVNHGPPVNAESRIIDAAEIGANTTIEIFELNKGGDQMKHLRTVFSSAVWTPNRPAALGDGAFVVSNDHSAKVGLRKELDIFLGGGNVAYCSPKGDCHAATTSLSFPNGLTKGKDGLIYVPSSNDGTVRVFELQSDKMLKQVDVIQTPMPLDNISPDANGDLWVAAFPSFVKVIAAIGDPWGKTGPATVLRIKKTDTGYQVDKILEDAESKVLSVATTVRHDAKTGRLFLGSALSPFMMVCDPL